MAKQIWFDMDGTIADLYSVQTWLPDLLGEKKGLFSNLAPKVDMVELGKICNKLMEKNWEIGVITWTPKNVSDKYCQIAGEEKRAWLSKYMPYVQQVHIQAYGTPKQDALNKRAKLMVLVDDNEEVRQMWETPKVRKTIDANKDIITELKKLLWE